MSGVVADHERHCPHRSVPLEEPAFLEHTLADAENVIAKIPSSIRHLFVGTKEYTASHSKNMTVKNHTSHVTQTGSGMLAIDQFPQTAGGTVKNSEGKGEGRFLSVLMEGPDSENEDEDDLNEPVTDTTQPSEPAIDMRWKGKEKARPRSAPTEIDPNAVYTGCKQTGVDGTVQNSKVFTPPFVEKGRGTSVQPSKKKFKSLMDWLKG